MMIPPARRSAATNVASRAAGASSFMRKAEPAPVTVPTTSTISLMPIGMPCNTPCTTPRASSLSARSASARAPPTSTDTQAPNSPSPALIRARHCSTSAVEVRVPDFIAARSAEIDCVGSIEKIVRSKSLIPRYPKVSWCHSCSRPLLTITLSGCPQQLDRTLQPTMGVVADFGVISDPAFH